MICRKILIAVDDSPIAEKGATTGFQPGHAFLPVLSSPSKSL